MGQQYIVHEEASSEETRFLIIADPRWRRTQPLGLNCLILPLRKDIHSLRDINATHLPLLHNIREKVKAILYQKFKIWASHLCIFGGMIPFNFIVIWPFKIINLFPFYITEYPPRSYRFYLRATQFDNCSISVLSDEIPDDLSPYSHGKCWLAYHFVDSIIWLLLLFYLLYLFFFF